MKKVCKECGINVSDERLIVCPECSGELVTKITNEQAQTIVLSDQQKSELIKAATKGAAKQLLKWSWGVIAVLAILSSIYSGWTLDQIYNKAIKYLQEKVNVRISEEFDSDRIKDTVAKVASEQSKELMTAEISPIVRDFKKDTDKQLDDLRREFEKSRKSIWSFAAAISIITKGEWTDGKPPDPSRLVRMSGGGFPGARVKLLLDGSDERWLDLEDPGDLRITNLSEGETRLQYRVEARPGAWIIGHHPQECVACREAQVFLWAFNAASTIDKTVVVKSITFRFFANGIPELVCEIKPERPVTLATEGSTLLTWRGDVAVQTP